MPTRQAIRAANAADTALYEHVVETFEDRLKRACEYVASRCLQKLPGGPEPGAEEDEEA